MKSSQDTDLLSLPIDQYSRQKWASEFIDQLRESKTQKLKILDVGGYKGKTAAFQPLDSVTVCDLFDVDEPGYVKGDGRSLPFANNEFDFVVTFDTYEHVPREGRKEFIAELTRVARSGVILAAPFDNEEGSVFQAEVSLNDYHRQLYDEDHRWLKEHIDYRIPSCTEVESLLDASGSIYTILPSNDLSVWVLMQTIYFSIGLDQEIRGRVDNVNRYYNEQYLKLDIATKDTAYRRIYFISSKKDNVSTISSYIDQEKNASQISEKIHFITFALSMFGVKYRDVQNHDQYLEKETIRLSNENKALKISLEKARAQLDLLNKPRLKDRAKNKFAKITRQNRH